MKKQFLGILAFGVMLMANQLSFATFLCSENWYLGGSPSINWHTDHKFDSTENTKGIVKYANRRSYKTGGGVNISLGYIFNTYRLECEIVYKRNALSLLRGQHSAVGRTQDIALMANILTDIPLYSCFDLFLGGGLGISFNELKLTSIQQTAVSHGKEHEKYFAMQIMSGLSYNISPGISLTAGYRLLGTQKVKNHQGVKSKNIPLTQSIDLGMRFRL